MKAKIKEFYLKYRDYIGGFIEFLIFLLFHIVTNGNKELFFIFSYSMFIITTTYLLVFKIEEVEKFIIKHFTLIMFLGIGFVLYSQSELRINNKDTLLMIGGILAFWYGYKKYERDKELEIIEKYTEKYKLLISNLYKKRNRSNYRNLFNLFYEEFFLKSKGYISDELWEQWEYWIWSDLNREFKEYNYNKIIEEIKNNKQNIESKNYFEYLFKNNGDKTENCKINGKSFYEYFNK